MAKKVEEPKEKTRYSDEELLEFKEIIQSKLDLAKADLKYYQDQISKKGDFTPDASDQRFRGLEDGTGTLEREELNQNASRLIKFVQHLDNALIRIENKSYGLCRETGKLIPKERLKRVPHATLSIEAKKGRK